MEEHAYRLAELERQVAKHKKDLYEGNGKPALTVRIAVMEDTMKELKWLARTLVVIALGILARVLVK